MPQHRLYGLDAGLDLGDQVGCERMSEIVKSEPPWSSTQSLRGRWVDCRALHRPGGQQALSSARCDSSDHRSLAMRNKKWFAIGAKVRILMPGINGVVKLGSEEMGPLGEYWH